MEKYADIAAFFCPRFVCRAPCGTRGSGPSQHGGMRLPAGPQNGAAQPRRSEGTLLPQEGLRRPAGGHSFNVSGKKKNVSGSRQRSSASRDGFPGSRGHSELVLIAVQDPRALRQKLKQEDKKQKPVSVLSRAQGGESGLPPLSKHTQGLVVTVLWG